MLGLSKNNFKKILTLLTIITVLTACEDNEDPNEITGEGTLSVKYDQSYGDNDLILNSQPNATSNSEVLKISTVKYIVSNIVLTKEDGTTFTYPKSESYFIIDESDAASLKINLNKVPAGDYTKIKFGIGVDEAQWALGADGQGDLYAKAQAAKMMWSWTGGYKFVAFVVHTGKTGSTYNYKEITLDFPTKAMVRTNIAPSVHIIADVSKIIDGKNKIVLMDSNAMGMGAMIMGGANLPLITENLSAMFKVDHVHND